MYKLSSQEKKIDLKFIQDQVGIFLNKNTGSSSDEQIKKISKHLHRIIFDGFRLNSRNYLQLNLLRQKCLQRIKNIDKELSPIAWQPRSGSTFFYSKVSDCTPEQRRQLAKKQDQLTQQRYQFSIACKALLILRDTAAKTMPALESTDCSLQASLSVPVASSFNFAVI